MTNRMIADSCQLSTERIGGLEATVGYKSQVKAASKMHVFTAVAWAEQVDGSAMLDYTIEVLGWANSRKGQWRGAQSGVIVLPVLMSSMVDSSAVAMVSKAQRPRFAMISQPVVVDLRDGAVHYFRGWRFWGFALNGLIRAKCELYLPMQTPADR